MKNLLKKLRVVDASSGKRFKVLSIKPSSKQSPAPILCKYRIEYACVDGRKGSFLGDTIEEVHEAISRDTILSPEEKVILKYGYFYEFRNGNYTTKHYTIDNTITFSWIVGGIERNEFY